MHLPRKSIKSAGFAEAFVDCAQGFGQEVDVDGGL
jgi:hypothetical protein